MSVFALTELQHADARDGPWALYIYGRNGYHSGKKLFRRGPMKYPDEEITTQVAKSRVDEAVDDKREVRICDSGDMLVFHSQNGEILFPSDPDGFWRAAGL